MEKWYECVCALFVLQYMHIPAIGFTLFNLFDRWQWQARQSSEAQNLKMTFYGERGSRTLSPITYIEIALQSHFLAASKGTITELRALAIYIWACKYGKVMDKIINTVLLYLVSNTCKTLD